MGIMWDTPFDTSRKAAISYLLNFYVVGSGRGTEGVVCEYIAVLQHNIHYIIMDFYCLQAMDQ